MNGSDRELELKKRTEVAFLLLFYVLNVFLLIFCAEFVSHIKPGDQTQIINNTMLYNKDPLLLILAGVCLFAGIYFICVNFVQFDEDPKSLPFALFCLIEAIHAFSTTNLIVWICQSSLIPDIVENISMFMLFAAFVYFIEKCVHFRNKVNSKLANVFCLIMTAACVIRIALYSVNSYMFRMSVVTLSAVFVVFMWIRISVNEFVTYIAARSTQKVNGKKRGIFNALVDSFYSTSDGIIFVSTLIVMAGAASAYVSRYFFGLEDTVFDFGILAIIGAMSYSFILRDANLQIKNAAQKKELFEMTQNLQIEVDRNTDELIERNLQLEQQSILLEEQTRAALAGNEAKSLFLAKMSHEIRTPMNAIIGMTELMMREDLSPRVAEFAAGVTNAGTSLLSLINDILDFSKIESGQMDIVSAPYEMESVVEDVVNIIRMRLINRPINFLVSVDPNIPRELIGDMPRVRQILLNLLSNAAKYTDEGQVVLNITAKMSEVYCELTATISDTGRGIKPEDLEKLFVDFVQVDTARNHSIQGTGLGLVIAKNLARLMGGNIAAQSIYGSGSQFTFTFPQMFLNNAPLVSIDAEKENILVFDGRSSISEAIGHELFNMGLKHTIADTMEAFENATKTQKFTRIFISSMLRSSVEEFINASNLRGELIIMEDYGDSVTASQQKTIYYPISSLTIASAINGKVRANGNGRLITFTAPKARVLVVDDVKTNLVVAQGLLAPYKVKLDTAISGSMAIDMVKNTNYDIIFMDHIMPEMDGIVTTAAIRDVNIDIPIIALTANAIYGVSEIFFEATMNDVLLKPIESSKLNHIMEKWIPNELKIMEEESNQINTAIDTDALPVIHDLDTEAGLSRTGGTAQQYWRVLEAYTEENGNVIHDMDALIHEKNLSAVRVCAHSLASASGNIGANNIYGLSKRMEAAAREGDIDTVKVVYSELSVAYEPIIKGLIEAVRIHNENEIAGNSVMHITPGKINGKGSVEGAFDDSDHLRNIIKRLKTLKEALKNGNRNDINRSIEELQSLKHSDFFTKMLMQLERLIVTSEYESAIKSIDGLLAADLLNSNVNLGQF